jgi:hypothetical protein
MARPKKPIEPSLDAARPEAIFRTADAFDPPAPPPKNKSQRLPRAHRLTKKRRKAAMETYQPNDEMRRTIANMASYGLDVMTISKLVELAPMTIYRHYGHEMKTAAAKKDLMVMQTGFLKAVGGPEQNWEKADAAMIRWWISVRQNWQLPAQRTINLHATLDLSKLSDQQLDELERIYEQAALEPGGHQAGEGGALIEADFSED